TWPPFMDFSGIPSSLIKRVEVVKGPASTLYGSEAVAGLINIITKDPASTASGIFTSDLNFTSYQELNADVSGKFSIGKANALVGLSAFWFDKKFDVNKDNFTDVTLQKRISLFNKWSLDRRSKQPMSIATRFRLRRPVGRRNELEQKMEGSDSIYGESIYQPF
ncbi:MAG: TonB-dependent receptor plug domain-containing protein, partial [Hymenobacter sp.]